MFYRGSVCLVHQKLASCNRKCSGNAKEVISILLFLDPSLPSSSSSSSLLSLCKVDLHSDDDEANTTQFFFLIPEGFRFREQRCGLKRMCFLVFFSQWGICFFHQRSRGIKPVKTSTDVVPLRACLFCLWMFKNKIYQSFILYTPFLVHEITLPFLKESDFVV